MPENKCLLKRKTIGCLSGGSAASRIEFGSLRETMESANGERKWRQMNSIRLED